MIQLMLITNDPALAAFAMESGVNRIFVDLEILGKKERQGHLDTLISHHSMDDVALIRAAIPQGDMLVRTNPLHDGSPLEVETVLASNPDFLMLPMFRTAEEVEELCQIVDGRVPVIPLIETTEASKQARAIAQVEGVDEVYIGLNDLHMDMGYKFMFQPLGDGTVDSIVAEIKKAGKRFGFGGIARLNEGLLPAEMILAEHVRLGSHSLILSRTFHRRSSNLDAIKTNMNFAEEIKKLRKEEQELAHRDSEREQEQSRQLKERINQILDQMPQK